MYMYYTDIELKNFFWTFSADLLIIIDLLVPVVMPIMTACVNYQISSKNHGKWNDLFFTVYFYGMHTLFTSYKENFLFI